MMRAILRCSAPVLLLALAACSDNPLDPDDIEGGSVANRGGGGGGRADAGGGGGGGGGGGQQATCDTVCRRIFECCQVNDTSAFNSCVTFCQENSTQEERDAYATASCPDIVQAQCP